ncbi:hypothetical protein HPB48_020759 [Haemaphysalis longicornis]|uniref:Uncharacterized protein n=1 Tax=Haemaphysalis longicornis TaxID=44386 RepID=A0A9J6H220_HAELO|nr:hypothetical protein HPB48_020759 [Haemaphysalis longicornis]
MSMEHTASRYTDYAESRILARHTLPVAASCHAGDRQPRPVLALALLLLCMQGVTATPPRRRFNWRTFIYCLDTKASVMLTLDGACAAVFLYTNYRTMLKANCPNCDL